MLRIGVMLSGCGVYDGSEIHEAVLTLLAIAENGAGAVCMAPDMEQAEVINHCTGKAVKEKRSVLVESARIARGQIKALKDIRAEELDALIFPGGFGAAKNLSTFASEGPHCRVAPGVAELAAEIHRQGKPIGAICISPALIARIFEKGGLRLTIGSEKETAGAVRALGHVHQDCTVRETCIDREHRIVTTPAYMLAQNITEAAEGIRKLVREVIGMAGK